MRRSDKRIALVEACRAMNALGINQGTSGNISLRDGETMLISPSATPYDSMRPEDVAAMPLGLEGADGAWSGPKRPSTEWRLHRGILIARPELGAVVHSHPIFCTALAMAGREIPAAHYMIACFGGSNVRCAAYAGFGTQALSDRALAALDGRNACLLANHGMVVCAPGLARAMWLAVELETLAKQYWHSLLIGGPALLGPREIVEAQESLAGYGQQDAIPPQAG